MENLIIKSKMNPMVRWLKSGPIIFNNWKLREVYNWNVNELIQKGEGLNLLDNLEDNLYECECEYHKFQLKEVIDYIKDKLN